MDKVKNVQIPETLFVQLYKYFLLDIQDKEICDSIKAGLASKWEAIHKRQLYQNMHIASTAEEQEQARQNYLEEIGAPDAFRWNAEYEQQRQQRRGGGDIE